MVVVAAPFPVLLLPGVNAPVSSPREQALLLLPGGLAEVVVLVANGLP